MKLPAEKPSQRRFRDFCQPARRSLQKLLRSEVSPMARLVWRRCTRRVHARADEALEPKLVSLACDRRLGIQVDVVAISGKCPQNLSPLANPSSE
jgi:hypothetical protein